jgi:NAD(P) transhydrogenase subunit alpha
MKIGVPKEIHPGENRVATTPEVAERLQKLGFSVAMESGAGEKANFLDDTYREAGVEIIADTKSLWASSELILKVRGE